jgi:site-specific DNA recombinase
MMENLKSGKAGGVIMHKIDRSARNLHDWAAVSDLIDSGIDVHFAHESLDMRERGGRLSADIQAVMASDYVRNLRQETIKGLYGRLKQGLYPWYAPIGYIDNGKGELKTIHPIYGKLVIELFQLYTTGKYNIHTLSAEMKIRGLKNKRGGTVDKNSIVKILKNPFYTGIISVKGKTFKGNHVPLIDVRTFQQAQLVLSDRQKGLAKRHNYLFRQMISCSRCKKVLSGECQKGKIYYRCHTKECSTKTRREDLIEYQVRNILKLVTLSAREYEHIREYIELSQAELKKSKEAEIDNCKFQISVLQNKDERLLEAYLDNVIDRENYDRTKKKILFEIQEYTERLNRHLASESWFITKIKGFFELCKSPLKYYDSATLHEKKEFLKIVTSNFEILDKKVVFTTAKPFLELANRLFPTLCAQEPDTQRILYTKHIYSDINTSPIYPKPFTKEESIAFCEYLNNDPECVNTIESLHHLLKPQAVPQRFKGG